MRVTGGVFRSRTLVAPNGVVTRPTSDRVREAMFSMVASRFELVGSSVLDLYAGTGALAFEALSRGASRAVCIEPDREALKALRRNADALGAQASVRIVATSVETWARRDASSAGAFDIVFADPPYREVESGAVGYALTSVATRILPIKPALWVLEHSAKDAAPAVRGLTCSDTRRYGDTALSFYGPEELGANCDESPRT
jgi:16S rRNA (guanine966-N2)-methyltransferase